MTDIHHSARQGFAVGAATYVAGRPDYPPEIADWLRVSLGLGLDKRVIEIGAGTGKFLPSLIAIGATVVAIEPVDAMRRQLEANFPAIRAETGRAEAIPLGDASADAVVCAQAFHWFASAQTLAEIHRVLKPGGRLGLVWNVRDQSVAWVAALTAIMAPYVGDTPRHDSGAWRAVFPAPGFGPLSETRFRHVHTGRPDDVIVARIMSVSFIAALGDRERADVEQAVRAVIAATPELHGERVSFPYETRAYACQRLD